MLSSYRVLDLTGQRGMFCSYLLAHLGADVLAIEPPESCAAQREGDPDLWWHAYARGKRNVCIDLESKGLQQLVESADFLIESFETDDLRRLKLDYDSLSKRNDRLIVVSITPFGRAGPKADWPATDLTVWAASGAHVLAGDDDRAPVRTSVPQAFLHAGADAAGAALIALQERHRSGRGQHVDVSAQQSSAQAALSAILTAPNHSGRQVERVAGGLRGTFPMQLTWPCRDGYVAITLLFGPAFSEANRRLLRWVHENGACPIEDVETDWGTRIYQMMLGQEAPEAYFALCKKIEAFTLTRGQGELFKEGLDRGIYIAPTLDIAGLLDEPQFEARDFWHSIASGGGAQGDAEAFVRVPGAFAKFSRSPLALAGRAVAADESDASDLGESDTSAMWNARKGSPAPSSTASDATASDATASDALPLAGLKVLDFMWVIAGPTFTRMLCDYGATVIKIESTTRLEPARPSPPFKDAKPGLESSVPFANFNAGKLGLTIDPSNPAGREVILDLVRWADVVTESFSPKAMKGWKLDFATLREVNPDLIMLSSCLMGQTGPRAQIPGYGNMAAAITGFYELTGWQDRSPAGPYLAYTDGVSPRFMLASLLAAIEHHRKTGEGQHIDISQAEAAIHFLAPAILEYEQSGRVWRRVGNRDRTLVPHGVYAARGEDRWVAIACQSDEAWLSLCRVMGLREEASTPALTTAAGRRQREPELDALIESWTKTRGEAEIERLLIEAGVAAHVVQNSLECCADPQLQYRNHFVSVAHPSMGDIVIEGTRFRLSRTPAVVSRSSPELGEHNVYVLEEILGYAADQIADVYASLAME